MRPLSMALQQGQWELASLYMLLGFLRASLEVPPDALEELIRTLEGNDGQKEKGP